MLLLNESVSGNCSVSVSLQRWRRRSRVRATFGADPLPFSGDPANSPWTPSWPLRGPYGRLLLGGSLRLWELGADDLRGQSLTIRTHALSANSQQPSSPVRRALTIKSPSAHCRRRRPSRISSPSPCRRRPLHWSAPRQQARVGPCW